MFIIAQNIKHVYVTFSFHELLIFFLLTLVDIFCLKFDFLINQKNTVLHTLNDEIKPKRIIFLPSPVFSKVLKIHFHERIFVKLKVIK